MWEYVSPLGSLRVDFAAGHITSLTLGGKEQRAAAVPLFTVRLRDAAGAAHDLTTYDAHVCRLTDDGAVYGGFPLDLSVHVSLTAAESGAAWRISIDNRCGMLLDWVDFPSVALRPLKKNGGEGQILFPFNEGALVDDLAVRERSWFPHKDPEYPSLGAYPVFPNMISSQFLCYLSGGLGLYCGAHDAARGLKGIDFLPCGDGVALRLRLFCGGRFGESWTCGFPIEWKFFRGDWQDGAELYRRWFEAHLPPRLCRVVENKNLPAWYAEAPLVVTYPVRGVHDMDKMEPNALFPYENALPLLDEIAARTGAPLLVLLMHWEGTAPWAPPYVWPPYGGEEMLFRFMDALHGRGHRLGVYCSGFSWTLKSNLIERYDNTRAFREEHLEEAMCAGPDGRVQLSRVCTGQRAGYDLCICSEKAPAILDAAYRPLLTSGIDYAQILDQNHGGGQYLCYSRSHRHPPAPGPWMTASMQKLLGEWNDIAPHMLLGCESAAAEPFAGNLQFSDNRFELNWRIGEPVPLYAYLYHEYLHNFMGNQCGCGLDPKEDTLCYRLAYSFTAGDCMSLVLTPDGQFSPMWSIRDFDVMPDRDNALTLIGNLYRLYAGEAGPFLHHGRMQKTEAVEGPTAVFTAVHGGKITPSCVLASTWEADGARATLLVNHTTSDVTVTLAGEAITVPALDGRLVHR